jgi:SAM-dependent methyltransferase
VSAGDARAFWEERYRRRDPDRAGRPHPLLADAVGATAPGEALDLGAGDGANAIWLASAGWRVTAVDLSAVALEHGARHARTAGVDDRITWRRADLASWTPSEDADLVCAFFLHGPFALDAAGALARAAARVRPGGALLVVGHATLPPWAWDHEGTAELPRAAELTAALGLGDPAWDVRRAEELPRMAVHGGERAEVLDAVVHAVRRA